VWIFEGNHQIQVRKWPFSYFPGPKTNWGERKPAQIWLVLAFSGPFWGVLGEERADADYWGVIDKFQ